MTDSVCYVLQGPCDNESTIGESNQNNVLKVFVQDLVDHVAYMSA